MSDVLSPSMRRRITIALADVDDGSLFADLFDELLALLHAAPTLAAATPYTVLPSDTILLIDVASAVINLPAGADLTSKRLVIKDRTGGATLLPITVNPDGAETIDGASVLSIDSNYASITLVFEGTNWSQV